MKKVIYCKNVNGFFSFLGGKESIFGRKRRKPRCRMDKVRNGICKKSRSEKSHFKPFLNVRLGTPEQKQALRNILEYCDETTLKVPFIMGTGVKMSGGIAQETRTADEMTAYYRDMSENEYERLKEMVWKGAKMKTGIMNIRHLLPGEKCRKSSKIKDITIYSSPI